MAAGLAAGAPTRCRFRLTPPVCTAAPPPGLTVIVAVILPVEVGVNTTLIVQLDPTATDVPQVLVCEN